jgi:hypothetical protein
MHLKVRVGSPETIVSNFFSTPEGRRFAPSRVIVATVDRIDPQHFLIEPKNGS